jgi:hypothetical protein
LNGGWVQPTELEINEFDHERAGNSAGSSELEAREAAPPSGVAKKVTIVVGGGGWANHRKTQKMAMCPD